MEEYNDNVEESIGLSLSNGKWVLNEAEKLIRQYKACKTAHAQNKLRPKMEYIRKKLAFESRELSKIMGYDNYGSEYDGETV
jgi:hypothetical protein